MVSEQERRRMEEESMGLTTFVKRAVSKETFTKDEALAGLKTILFLIEESECDLLCDPKVESHDGVIHMPIELLPKHKSDFTQKNSPEQTAINLIGSYLIFNRDENSFVHTVHKYGIYDKIVLSRLGDASRMKFIPRFIVRKLLCAFIAFLQSMAAYRLQDESPQQFQLI